MKRTEQPTQPFVMDNGVVRFRANSIVQRLLEEAGVGATVDLNDIAVWDLPHADMRQFMQLLGYSISGYGDLSYVGPVRATRMDEAAERFMRKRKRKRKRKKRSQP